ncbi:hypothetical protein H8959_010931 [Pygathrix nigripes]
MGSSVAASHVKWPRATGPLKCCLRAEQVVPVGGALIWWRCARHGHQGAAEAAKEPRREVGPPGSLWLSFHALDYETGLCFLARQQSFAAGVAVQKPLGPIPDGSFCFLEIVPWGASALGVNVTRAPSPRVLEEELAPDMC